LLQRYIDTDCAILPGDFATLIIFSNSNSDGAARFRMKAPWAVGRQFRFSTHALPERERLPAWGDVLTRTLAKLDLEPVERAAFHAEATVCQLPALGVVSASSSVMHLRHTPDPIADDDLAFVAAPSCAWSVA
jgi:hypothetical protein